MTTPTIRRAFVALLAMIAASCGGASTVDTTAAQAAPTTTEVVTTTIDEVTTTESHMDHSDEEGHDEEMEEMGSSEADRTVEVVMTEFAFEPESIEVSAGETILFVVHNEGLVDHEFRLSNPHRIEEHMASGHEDHDEEGRHHEGGDVFVTVKPGEVGEMMMTFPEDTELYTHFACLIPGHHEAGMEGALSYGDA